MTALPGRRSLRELYDDLNGLLDREVRPDYFDRALRSLHTFHTDPHDLAAQQRRWKQVPVRLVTPSHVRDVPPEIFAGHLWDSRQIELPIEGYSVESGDALQLLLPSLARFMGKTQAQHEESVARQEGWCASTWCAEERRHAALFGRILERLTGAPPVDVSRRSTPRPGFTEPLAIAHLLDRGAAEWAASGSYLVYALHSRDELRELFLNVIRDELKHLALMSAADRYLLGPRGFARVRDSLRSLGELRRQNQPDPLPPVPWSTSAVQLYALVEIQRRLSRWLRTLPLSGLTEVFEAPSLLAPLAERPLPPDEAGRRDAALRESAHARATLRRWPTGARRRALRQRELEHERSGELAALVSEQLGGFRGAEQRGSRADAEMIARIGRVAASSRGIPRLEQILLDALRSHQIGCAVESEEPQPSRAAQRA